MNIKDELIRMIEEIDYNLDFKKNLIELSKVIEFKNNEHISYIYGKVTITKKNYKLLVVTDNYIYDISEKEGIKVLDSEGCYDKKSTIATGYDIYTSDDKPIGFYNFKISNNDITTNFYSDEYELVKFERESSRIMLTTTNNIDGYRVKNYIDIESVEIVIGTGLFSEFTGELQDIFGKRSTEFESKLNSAKKLAFDKLKYSAYKKGGNAIIGIDIDYTEFTGNRIGVIVNGTIVEIEKIDS